MVSLQGRPTGTPRRQSTTLTLLQQRRHPVYTRVVPPLIIRETEFTLNTRPAPRPDQQKLVVYGVFKAMGDLLCALPVVKHELQSGTKVVLVVFPQLLSFLDLIEFGPLREDLTLHVLPSKITPSTLPRLLRSLSRYAPDIVWISPHAPGPASSWKVPLLFWLARRLYWHNATLAGLQSERFSHLFDRRIPVDRRLPFLRREWTGYSLIQIGQLPAQPPTIRFKDAIQNARLLPPAYDLLIHPGAGAINRKWPLTHYPALLQHLPAELRIAVLGLPQDIAAMQSVLPDDRQIDYFTGSLADAITRIATCRVALTMDSGNAFFAQILNVPAVALFGASDPANVIGLEGPVQPLFEQKFSCQPCGRTQCQYQDVMCMSTLTPNRVAERIRQLLVENP